MEHLNTYLYSYLEFGMNPPHPYSGLHAAHSGLETMQDILDGAVDARHISVTHVPELTPILDDHGQLSRYDLDRNKEVIG